MILFVGKISKDGYLTHYGQIYKPVKNLTLTHGPIKRLKFYLFALGNKVITSPYVQDITPYIYIYILKDNREERSLKKF
jgi:hypothetical protein